jgi:iron-sulfur cluster assembly accessory protein
MSDTTTAVPSTDADPAAEGPVMLTDSAASKVQELMSREEDASAIALRIAVQPGGCAGMRYALYFDDRQLDSDVVADVKGVPVRVDKMSSPYLRGTTIDWVDSLQGAGFSIDNPNSQSSCACGDSFN